MLDQCGLDWRPLRDTTLLITGATGMLASYLSFLLMYLNDRHRLGMTLLLLARNRARLEAVFGPESGRTKFLVQDVCDEIGYAGAVDYIVHAAGDASPHHIVADPVGIIRANVVGTENAIALARARGTRTIVFASTREIYGKVEQIESIAESDMGTLDPLDPRSCYPESKRMAETLLASSAARYGIRYQALRIAHVYGPGMRLDDDGRVMADFMNDALGARDIRLNSAGRVERSFCYISDCVEAIVRVLLCGTENEAYNIANEDEPIAVIELARLLQRVSGNGRDVAIATDAARSRAYVGYRTVRLDTAKLRRLGWRPRVSLESGIRRTMNSFEEDNRRWAHEPVSVVR